MFVFIPGSIPPVIFGPDGTDPAEISIPPVTYTHFSLTFYIDTCEVVNSGKCIYYGTTAETFSVAREVRLKKKQD